MKNKKPLSELNFVPFIDIMLVLLIIFMISSTQMNNLNEIEIPNYINNDVKVDSKNNLQILKILKNEEYLLNDEKIDLIKLFEKININETIYIAADKNVSYGKIIELMNELKKNNVSKVSLLLNDL